MGDAPGAARPGRAALPADGGLQWLWPLLRDARHPEFLPECGYGAVYKKADALREALARTDLPPDKQRELARKLRLDE